MCYNMYMSETPELRQSGAYPEGASQLWLPDVPSRRVGVQTPHSDIAEFAEQLPVLMDQLTVLNAGNSTTHYAHPDYPQLHIKASDLEVWDEEQSPTYEQRLGVLARQDIAYRNLAKAGVVTLPPFRLRLTRPKFYVIARKVDGVPLEEVLSTDPYIQDRRDQVFAGLVNLFSSQRGANVLLPFDIFTAGQCMWGTIPGQDPQPNITFVDIDTTSGGIIGNCRATADASYFANALGTAASALLADEEACDIRFVRARASLEHALDTLIGSEAASRRADVLEGLRTNNRDLTSED